MTTPSILIGIVFVLCLAAPVATRSVGLVTPDDKPAQKWLVPLMFGLSQGIMALLGSALSRLIGHLFTYIADYLVFAMMLVVAVKMFVDSMRILKGKMLYTVTGEKDVFLLTVMAAINTLLMSFTSFRFMPFGWGFPMAVAAAGFLWAFVMTRKAFEPKMIKNTSFIEFSAAVFMVVIAVLYLFTDLIGFKI